MTMKNENSYKFKRFTDEEIRKMTPGERRKRGLCDMYSYDVPGTYDFEKNPNKYEYAIGRDC